MKKNKIVQQKETITNKKDQLNPRSPWDLLKKVVLLFSVVLIVVVFIDKKGYFKADQSNNHIRKKWASFYNFTEKKEVDVLLLGNSHIITGIEPYVLSNATSSTCFILGNSGTGVIDAWFQLGEALKHTKPKLVILETYAINNADKPKGDVMPYLQSFDAQKNLFYKLKCMPQIFNTENWIEAWSTCIRNHSFLLTDTARINYNIKNPEEPISTKLNLGRFARFDFGLQDSTLKKYDAIGAPTKGEEFKISSFTKKYLQKIMEMCEEKNIPVMFLTVPMYYKHISNYNVWKTTLSKELEKYPQAKWYDLQMPYDTGRYTPEMFENTYAQNQHLSNSGMITTAYKVAEYIDKNYPSILPDRSKQPEWMNDFMNTPHFEFNQDIPNELSGYTSILKDKNLNNFHIRELVIQELEQNNRIILKLYRKSNLPNELNVRYKIETQGGIVVADIKMYKFQGVTPPKHDVFVIDIKKDFNIKEILGINI